MTRLRLQLVGILILVALLPALPAALAVRALVGESLDPLLETRIEAGVEAGVAATRTLLGHEIAAFREALEKGSADTLRLHELEARDRATLEALRRASGTLPVVPQRVELLAGDRLVAAAIERDGAVWFAQDVPETLSRRAAQLTESLSLLKGLRHERGQVHSSLLSAFLVVYGGILAAVLLFGLVLASRVTRPLTALGAGIGAVAAGRLDTRVSPGGGGGAIGGLIGQFNGMVERLATQRANLVRLEKLAAWRQMARRLAHEVKNPLTPIQLAAQEMRDACDGSDASYRTLVTEGASIIEEEVASLRTLVSSFSEFTRMPDPSLEAVDVSDIALELAHLYGSRASVTVDAPDSGSDVSPTAAPAGLLWCDRDQIHRALVNLVNNALDAQAAAGVEAPVEVEVRVVCDAVVVTIADRGPGVPQHLLTRIFDPDVTTKSDGMGLGLSIVKHTVEAHGGIVDVAARPGGGAVFRVAVPVGDARRESQPAPGTRTASRDEHGTGGRNERSKGGSPT